MKNHNARILILIIGTCLLRFSGFGQHSLIDSLKNLSAKAPNDSLKAFYLNKVGKEYWYINSDTSRLYTNKAYGIAKRKNITGLFPYCQNNLGVLDFLEGNYHVALGKYFEGLKYVQNNKIILGILLNNIGMVYQELRDYEKSREYYIKTLQLKKEGGDSSRLAPTYNSIGISFNSTQQYDIAKSYFDSAYYFGNKYQEHYAEADALGNIANYFFRKKDFMQAEVYCRKALAIKQTMEDAYGVSTSYSDLGAILLNQNKSAEAEKALLSAEKLAMQNSYYDLLVPVYQNMSELNAKRGDYKKSLFYITKTIALKDSILSDGKIREAAIKEKEYAYSVTAVKDSLRLENEKVQTHLAHEKELYKQRLFVYGAVIVALLMLMIALIVFRAFRQKQRSNIIIEQQKKEVEAQKEIVEEKQKEILDSIQYAKRIQNTLLAHHEFLDEHLPNNFVLFKPKDIVSGDFYWATSVTSRQDKESGGGQLQTANRQLFYLAVCDSTGHGVPGAFMSLLNIGFLSEAINEKNILEPHKIFDYVRHRLTESVSKEGQKDGFDGILLCFELSSFEEPVQNLLREGSRKAEDVKITYAAAHNAPILISNDELTELPKDKMPVGVGERHEGFSLHTLNVKAGDSLYLYTDGFADQFGGPKGKKFKYKQLEDLLLAGNKRPLSEQAAVLQSAFDAWRGTLEQVDDVCVIGIKF